ncbi:N-6 DNA methylase [Geodermatophilus sp. CPCC 206100]|uniref:N-6 DNA methylase n=1 Tax=Geodermatophilus sp. CPCC 206100 TaxID=3020054 RepID=UPI003AFFAB28
MAGLDPHRPEIVLAQRLDRLHQLIYTRGGIRPVNAAVDELAKLLLLKIALVSHPELPVAEGHTLSSALDPAAVERSTDVSLVKRAFTTVNAHADFHAGRGSTARSVWPLDEPLRLSEPDVVAAALRLVLELEWHEAGGRALDPLGTAFDVFLQGRYDHSGGLGSYLTPASVAATMARIGLGLVGGLDLGDRVVAGDPCCGTGRFLTALAHEVASRGTATPHDISTGLFGSDQSGSAVAMAQVNMLSYGGGHAEIFTVRDSVTAPAVGSLAGTLQLILTNPPFGDGKYDSREGIAVAGQWMPQLKTRTRIDPALAFVARCLDLLRDGGVLGIVLPDGLIDGTALRKLLLGGDERVSVEASVSLPTSAFALSGTVAKTSAVFLRKGAGRTPYVHLARAAHIGYLKQAGGAVPDPGGDDLPSITAAIKRSLKAGGADRIVQEEPLVARVERAALSSLDPARLDPQAVAARNLLQTSGACEVREWAKAAGKRRAAVSSEEVPFVSVLHIDDLGTIDWLAADAYRPVTPGILARGGQLIVSLLNPRVFRAAVVPEDRPVVQCSAEFGVFDTSCDPYGLLALLQSQQARAQLAPLGRGTSSSRRRIDPDDVLTVLVPAMSANQLAVLGQRVRAAQRQLAACRAELADAYRPPGLLPED